MNEFIYRNIIQSCSRYRVANISWRTIHKCHYLTESDPIPLVLLALEHDQRNPISHTQQRCDVASIKPMHHNEPNIT